MSTRTLILIMVLILVTSGLVWLAASTPYYPKPQPKLIPTPTPNLAQTVLRFDNLSMSTNSASQKPTYSLPIIIDTKKNMATAVQLELQYDPKILANVAIEPGKFFANPVTLLNNIDVATGRISYAIGINPQETGKKGEGTVAVLTFQTKSQEPTATTISFLSKTLVTAEGIAQSVLKTAVPTQFIVGGKVRY